MVLTSRMYYLWPIPTSGIKILVELPFIKFSNDYVTGTDLNAIARQNYTYQTVKEKLAVGDKWILSPTAPDDTKSFRVQVVNQKNFSGLTSEARLDQTGSYLKVTNVIKGTQLHPVLGVIKTMEVIFDLNAKRYPSDQSAGQPQKLTGFLRMKYTQKY